MEKKIWFRRCSSFEEEEEADREFWAQMTGDERVEVLEEMRHEEWKAGDESSEGLRRAVRVVQRKAG